MSEEKQNPFEEVRRMLDEREIDYTIDDSNDYEIIEWSSAYNLWWQFVYDPYEEMPYGELRLLEAGGSTHLTPEQAIAATVGRPKVKKVRGTTYDEHGSEVYYLACSGCGEWIDGDLDCITEFDGPNFCPNCGGEFDGPLLCKRCGGLADLEYGDMCVECYEEEAE